MRCPRQRDVVKLAVHHVCGMRRQPELDRRPEPLDHDRELRESNRRTEANVRLIDEVLLQLGSSSDLVIGETMPMMEVLSRVLPN